MVITNLEEFIKQFSSLLEQKSALPEFIPKGRELLSQLVTSQNWLQNTLERLVLDESFLLSQWHSVDPNDITLYRSPDKTFSVRAFIWESGVTYPVHDHGAWGIVGAHLNKVRERKFIRVDNKLVDGYAEIKQTTDTVLDVGGTTVVLPEDQGLHQMEAVDGLTCISIHVYGAPVRKGYIQIYNQNDRTVYRAYPPQTAKKVLAIKALGSIDQPWAENILQQAENQPADFIQKESWLALANLAKLKQDKMR